MTNLIVRDLEITHCYDRRQRRGLRRQRVARRRLQRRRRRPLNGEGHAPAIFPANGFACRSN
jgi:hypothetical protein